MPNCQFNSKFPKMPHLWSKGKDGLGVEPLANVGHVGNRGAGSDNAGGLRWRRAGRLTLEASRTGCLFRPNLDPRNDDLKRLMPFEKRGRGGGGGG